MEVTTKDVAPFLETKVITIDNDAVAAGSGDGSEVTPTADIDLRPYASGVVHISYVTTLTAQKTLAFGLQEEHSAASGGVKSADAVLLASTAVITGAQTATEGTYDIPISGDTLASIGPFCNFLITPELNADNTDTVTWSAVFIGLKKNV